jgi:hypothetical protein
MLNIEFHEEGLTRMIYKMKEIAQNKLTNTEHAVETAADLIHLKWREAVAQGTQLEYNGQSFIVHRRTGNYEQQIIKTYPFLTKLSALIEAKAPYSDYIENGVQPYDMKPKLLKGRQYIHIPFRHGTGTEEISPTGLKNMPSEILNMIHQSAKLGRIEYGRRSKIIQTMEKKRQTYTWKTGPYSGMMQEGAKYHQQYITFRTISLNSDPNSWWHPGTPPRPISRAIAETAEPIVRELLEQALEKDIEETQQ